MCLEYLIAASDDVENAVYPPLLQELMQFDVKAWLAYTHQHFHGKRRPELETLFKWVHVRVRCLLSCNGCAQADYLRVQCQPKFPHGLTAIICNGLCRHWRGPIDDYLDKYDKEFKQEIQKRHAPGKVVKQKKMELWGEFNMLCAHRPGLNITDCTCLNSGELSERGWKCAPFSRSLRALVTQRGLRWQDYCI
jgi:hypothetical protein